jgi:Ca2+-binding EF-hand superfamily protein
MRRIGTIGIILAAALGAPACSGSDKVPPQAESQSALSAPGASARAGDSARDDHDGRHGKRGKPSAAEMIQRFDQNGDGKLQVSELPDRAKEHLAAADTNHDGVLTPDEIEAGFAKGPRHEHAMMGARDLSRFDENHDGKVELDELPAPMRKRFEAADTNMDGVLSVEEIKAAFAARFAERFKEMDKNGDGTLTADEVDKRRWEHMSVADTNKDGKLTLAELQKAHEDGTLRPPHRDGAAHPDDSAN